MGIFSKREALPDAIKNVVSSREKVFAWARHGGGFLAATNLGLITIDSHDATRIDWPDAIAGKWEPPLLTVTCLPNLTNVGWQLDEPGMLPQAVRDRITAHVLIDRTINFPGHGSVRMVARKTPKGISWLTNSQDEIWAESKEGKAAISAELSSLRASLGI